MTTPPVTPPPPPTPSPSPSRAPWIIGIGVVIILLVGYCATRCVKIGKQMMAAAARMDTTHHVPAGSGVYFGDTLVAPLIKVIVIPPDTTTPASGTDTTGVLARTTRQGWTMYTAQVPTDSLVVRRLTHAPHLSGTITGTYDGPTPIHVSLMENGPAQTATAKTSQAMLTFAGTKLSIPLSQ